MLNVRLLAPHTHGGVVKVKGDVIRVNVAQSEWLIARGIAVIEAEKEGANSETVTEIRVNDKGHEDVAEQMTDALRAGESSNNKQRNK